METIRYKKLRLEMNIKKGCESSVSVLRVTRDLPINKLRHDVNEATKLHGCIPGREPCTGTLDNKYR